MNTRFTSMGNFVDYDNSDKIQCPVCGEFFKAAPEHAYYIGKNRKNYCCTYSCMREWDAHRTTVPIEKKAKKRIPVRIVETGETFNCIKDCAAHLNVYPSEVQRAVGKGYMCHGYHIERIKEGDLDDDC